MEAVRPHMVPIASAHAHRHGLADSVPVDRRGLLRSGALGSVTVARAHGAPLVRTLPEDGTRDGAIRPAGGSARLGARAGAVLGAHAPRVALYHWTLNDPPGWMGECFFARGPGNHRPSDRSIE